MKILIAGCGYVGTLLGEELAKSGHEVWGLRRDWTMVRAIPVLLAGRHELPVQGIIPITADLLDLKSLTNLPEADYLVLCQAPSGENDSYQKTYFEGTQNILKIFSKKIPNKVIFISSTSVYSAKNGEWIDENTDPKVGTVHELSLLNSEAECLLRTEALVLKEMPSIVFRLGGIYGPARNRVDALKEGRLKPSFSDVFVNRIHVEDAAAGIELLLEKGKINEIYLGVDDYPSTQKEFYEWICGKLSLSKTADDRMKDTARVSNKRCSNKKIKELGFKLKYPTFREGYSELINNER